MSSYSSVLALLGRVLLALIFVLSGQGKIGGFAGTAAAIASKGLPLAEVLAVLTILIELGGGLLLILGWKARWAALIIFLFLIPVSIAFHPLWTTPNAEAMQNQINFMKNLSIMGGMLMVAAFGPGRYSIDRG